MTTSDTIYQPMEGSNVCIVQVLVFDDFSGLLNNVTALPDTAG